MEPDRTSIQSPAKGVLIRACAILTFIEWTRKKTVCFCYILAWHWNVFIYTHDNVKTTTRAIYCTTLSLCLLCFILQWWPHERFLLDSDRPHGGSTVACQSLNFELLNFIWFALTMWRTNTSRYQTVQEVRLLLKPEDMSVFLQNRREGNRWKRKRKVASVQWELCDRNVFL